MTNDPPSEPAPPGAPGASEPAGGPAGARPGLAVPITALVLALLPGCPFTGLAGALLGAVTLVRIRRRWPGLRRTTAERIALAAVVAGALSSLLWTSAYDRVSRGLESAQLEAVADRAADVIAASAAGTPGLVRNAWTEDDRAPDDEAIEAFGRAVRERYGGLDRFDIVATTPYGPALRSEFESAGQFHFGRTLVSGAVRYKVFVGITRPFVDCRLEGIMIEDEARGALRLGWDDPATDDPPSGDSADDAGGDPGG